MFKKGDKVWSVIFGWGIVKEILGPECSSDYKVRVRFKDRRIETFTLEGRYFEGLRDLFFEEIPIPKSALERPRKSAKEMLNECKEIEFRNNEDNFYIGYNHDLKKIRCCIQLTVECLGIKYISEEDAKRIVRECKENNI